MFEPRLALASLSGQSNATWARAATPHVGTAFLGGIAICPQTRRAARGMVERDRTEFLPDDAFAFVDEQFRALADTPIRPGINVRSTDPDQVARMADVCAAHDAILEVNAHCRQDEMCAAGAGETLLANPDRLASLVSAAATEPIPVTVKVRAEVPDVDLTAVARTVESAGADGIHVDAMDTAEVIADVVAASDLFVIANNGVRDRRTTEAYLGYGADAVSVGRASDRPVVLRSVSEAVTDWFDVRADPVGPV